MKVVSFNLGGSSTSSAVLGPLLGLPILFINLESLLLRGCRHRSTAPTSTRRRYEGDRAPLIRPTSSRAHLPRRSSPLSQEEPFRTYKSNREEYNNKVKAQVQLLRQNGM